MDQTERILGLVSEGIIPSLIAKQVQLNPEQVIQVISKAVSEGKLRRSDVLAAFDKDWRGLVDNFADSEKQFPSEKMSLVLQMFDMPHDIPELELYLSYRVLRATASDTYQILSDLERTLHALIKTALVKHFQSSDSGWWAQGVPQQVRVSCAGSRELDEGYSEHPYSYTTLIHLWQIMENNWDILKEYLSPEATQNRKVLKNEWVRMNAIRNRVMHPVRGEPPTDEEYEFVKEMKRKLQPKLS